MILSSFMQVVFMGVYWLLLGSQLHRGGAKEVGLDIFTNNRWKSNNMLLIILLCTIVSPVIYDQCLY